MKGYIVDGKAYIFPQTAAEIPEVEADLFYVQEENFTEWVAENESIADKLVKYNYNLISVQPKVWAGHTDDDIYVPVSPELAWSSESATAQIGETNTFPTLTNPHSVTVSYSSSDSEKATIDASTGEITLVAAGETTISAVFAGDDTYEAQTVTYALTVNAAQPEPETYSFTINISDEADPINVGSYAEGAEVTYTFDGTYEDSPGVSRWDQSITPSDLVYEFDPGSTYYDDELQEDVVTNASISFTMPASDVTFELVYVPLYSVAINNSVENAYPVGTDVELLINKDYGNLVEVSPSDLAYTVDTETNEWNNLYYFEMPEENVNFTMELPAPGTEFAFNGYEHAEDVQTSSTGTVYYQGIYADDSTYITGTALVTFTGAAQEVEQTVFMLRSDIANLMNGTRITVYVMNNDQLVQFGYGEFVQQ